MSKAPLFTEADLLAHAARHKLPPPDGLTTPRPKQSQATDANAAAPEVTPKKVKAVKMTQAERDYAAVLDAMQRRGDILGWLFEPVSMRCGDGQVYSPDFLVRVGGTVELEQVKKLATYTALDAVGYPEARAIQQKLLEQEPAFLVVEIKAKNRQGKGFISRDAKPRFLAAKERHTWAKFSMIEKQADGSFKEIL